MRHRPISEKQTCSFCLECNPECLNCENSVCPDMQRLCPSCSICDYLSIDKLNEKITDFSSSFGQKNCISLLSINTRSLTKYLDSVTDLLHNLKYPIDILCISETKLNTNLNDSNNDNLNSRVQIDGYKFISKHSKLLFGGAGIYISNHIKFDRRPDLEFDMEDCETCFIEVKTHAKQKNLIIGSIYRHPHDSNLDEFFSEFIKTAEKILQITQLYWQDILI